MIHDRCDYCFREFGYQPGERPVCVNCAVENVRPGAARVHTTIETATPARTPERAVRITGRGKRPSRVA